MSLRIRIENLEFFKNLSKVQQNITLKRTNRMEVEDAYVIAKNIGYDKWEKQSRYNYVHIGIVKALLAEDEISKQ